MSQTQPNIRQHIASTLLAAALVGLSLPMSAAHAENAASQQTSSDAPIAILNYFASKTQTMQGEFKQMSFNDRGKLEETSTGLFAARMPNQFYWDYQDPFPQTIVADGQKVYVYDPDLEQVTIKSQNEQTQQSPLAMLGDPVKMQQHYHVSFAQKKAVSDSNITWLELLPKEKDNQVAQILMGFDEQTLVAMTMMDGLKRKTSILFSQTTVNKPLDDTLFEFVVPDGVDVVDGTQNQSQQKEPAEVMPLGEN